MKVHGMSLNRYEIIAVRYRFYYIKIDIKITLCTLFCHFLHLSSQNNYISHEKHVCLNHWISIEYTSSNFLVYLFCQSCVAINTWVYIKWKWLRVGEIIYIAKAGKNNIVIYGVYSKIISLNCRRHNTTMKVW